MATPKITSIKLRPDQTEIEFNETKNTQTVSSLLHDPAPATPEFFANFHALNTIANQLCDGKLVHFKAFKVTQIWFKESKDGARGCMMHVEIKLENNNRPLHLNTPPKYGALDDQEETDQHLNADELKLLATLEQNAHDYMHGVRAQAELNFNQAENDQAEAKTDEAATAPRLGKNRRRCAIDECEKPSVMILEGKGYCSDHGRTKQLE